jgi:hypothetical protein
VVTVGVSSPEEAVATADQPGYPVTPKSRSGEILNPYLHLERWIRPVPSDGVQCVSAGQRFESRGVVYGGPGLTG